MEFPIYVSQKWSDCHETKSKHIDWTLGLKCHHQVWPWPWPWPWIFKVKYGICYISAKNGLIATERKANITIELQGLKCDHQVWPWPWPWPRIFKVKYRISYISAKKKNSHRRGGCLIMAMSTDACWGGAFLSRTGHFCVEPGIFVLNRVFLCRTMYFAVEPGFFVSNECCNCRIKTGSGGVCCHNARGRVGNRNSNPDGVAGGIWRTLRTSPSALWQQTPTNRS